MRMSKGRLIVFSAPSGCGKGTMLAEILKDENYCVSVSATTRSPREGEVDGVNYYFMSKGDFLQRVADSEFLEYAEYCDNYYGTLMSEVDGKLNEGKNVILEIEVQGAQKIREKRPDALMIFILPPSVSELRRRLKKRGTETDEVIEQRAVTGRIHISRTEALLHFIRDIENQSVLVHRYKVRHALRRANIYRSVLMGQKR